MQVEHVSIWPPNPPSPQTLGGSGSTLSKFNPVSSDAQENTHRHTHTGTNTHTYVHRDPHTYIDTHKRTNEYTHSHLNPKLFAIYTLLRTSDTSSHCSHSRRKKVHKSVRESYQYYKLWLSAWPKGVLTSSLYHGRRGRGRATSGRHSSLLTMVTICSDCEKSITNLRKTDAS